MRCSQEIVFHQCFYFWDWHSHIFIPLTFLVTAYSTPEKGWTSLKADECGKDTIWRSWLSQFVYDILQLSFTSSLDIGSGEPNSHGDPLLILVLNGSNSMSVPGVASNDNIFLVQNLKEGTQWHKLQHIKIQIDHLII